MINELSKLNRVLWALIFFAATVFSGCNLPGAPPPGGKSSGGPLVPPAPVDLTAPLPPTDWAMIPASGTTSNVTSPIISGHAPEEGTAVGIFETANCSGNPLGTGSVIGGAFSVGGFTLSTLGVQTFYYKIWDVAGNSTLCNTTGLSYTLVNTPVVSIDVPSAGAYVNLANRAAFAVSGTCSETGQPVSLAAGSATASPTCAGLGPVYTYSTTMNLTAVSDGSVTITADHMSASSVPATTASVNVTKDTVAPNVAITSPTGAGYVIATNQSAFTVSGSCNESGGTVNLAATGGSGSATATATCTGTGFAGAMNLSSLSEGSITISANLSDAAGNAATQSSVSPTKDTVAPTIGSWSMSPASGSTSANASPTFGGTSNEAGSLTFHASTDTSCSTALSSSNAVTTSAFSALGLTSPLSGDGAKTFYYRIQDTAGNVRCTSTGLSYTLDTTAPSAPASWAMSSPSSGSTSNDTTPAISGNASENSAIVSVWDNSGCTGGALASGTVSGGAYSIGAFTESGDGAKTFYFKIADPAGNATSCATTGLSYTLDTTAPAAPSNISTSPAGPANNNSPRILGTAEASSSISVYATSNCSGSIVATGTTAAFASPGIAVSVSDDTTTSFTAKATDTAGNVSACSSAVSYTEDSTAPSAPSSLSFNPASPANNNSPKILGTAESGSMVNVYSTSDCSGSITATGSAAAFVSPGFALSVNDDTSSTFTAKAIDASGNVSACSSSVSYTEDSTAPSAPSGLSMSPAGPANNNSPKVVGTAESGSTVSVYATNNCSGSAVATGSAATFASPGIAVSVNGDTTTSFTAQASDAAGNVSVCSSSVSFVEDSTAPTLSITTPSGGAAVDNSNQQNFTVSGACTDALSGVTGRTVTLSATGTSGSSSASATCNGSTYSTTIDLSSLGEGSATITADISDAASNNATQASVSVTKATCQASTTAKTSAASTTYTVPSKCLFVTVKAWGGGGGSGGAAETSGSGAGGGGANVITAISTTPAESLTAIVGGGGGAGAGANTNRSGSGAGGGAASAVKRSTTFLVVAAGGGGGGGSEGNPNAGSAGGAGGGGAVGSGSVASGTTSTHAGGGSSPGGGAAGASGGATGGAGTISGTTADDGGSVASGQNGNGGAGGAGTATSAGTAVTGGTAGSSSSSSLDGGAGGAGDSATNHTVNAGGGGGGGGYYAGAGGAGGSGGGGGGGGASYGTGSTPVFTGGSGTTAGGTLDGNCTASAGNGGASVATNNTAGYAGNTGCIVLYTYYDNSAPSNPSSLNMTGTGSTTATPALTWSASTDSGTSGMDHYEIAIGTTSLGTNTLAFSGSTSSNVGNVTSATVSGLTLTSGVQYFVSIRAVDRNGNHSGAVSFGNFVPP